MTTQVEGSVFEVAIPRGAGVDGVVLANQVRALDWVERKASYQSKAPRAVTEEVIAYIEAILNPD